MNYVGRHRRATTGWEWIVSYVIEYSITGKPIYRHFLCQE